MTTRSVLVTGAARGIGRACVERFLAEGWRVTAGVRDAATAELPPHPELAVVQMDVRDGAQVRSAVAAAEQHAGGALDCLVPNAGHALLGAQEDADLDQVRAMFETNFFGASACVQAALPGMREAGRGSVVFVSSVGSRIVPPLLGFYNATKYAMTAIAEALRLEVAPRGIRTHLIEPGMVNTEFPLSTLRSGPLASGEGPYVPLAMQVRDALGHWRTLPCASAEDVAEAVVGAATDPASPFRILVGEDAELLARERAARDDAEWHGWWNDGFLGGAGTPRPA